MNHLQALQKGYLSTCESEQKFLQDLLVDITYDTALSFQCQLLFYKLCITDTVKSMLCESMDAKQLDGN